MSQQRIMMDGFATFFPVQPASARRSGVGVHHYQDSADKSSTANLRYNAIRCFGEDAVKNAQQGDRASGQDGSIFAAFARQGQQPVQYSHKTHTNTEVRYVALCRRFAHMLTQLLHSTLFVQWVTENSRSANIVNDRALCSLLMTGRPHFKLPSQTTVLRDIQAAFIRCHETVTALLKNHPGLLHFATDAWTSPNHRAFIAWTVHLEFKGKMLCFLLDIIEVAEVRCTSLT
jgi:hypothetical protein